MYLHADEPWGDEPDRDEPSNEAVPFAGDRGPAPVPLAIAGAVIALALQFLGLFLLAWGMAPTSVGCGTGRAAGMVLAQIPVALLPLLLIGSAGRSMLDEAGAPRDRRRSFLMTFGALYALGSVPLFAAAALFGSCFDF